MRAICPKDPNHKRFATVAHVMEEWEVNEHGDWMQTLDTLETSFPPNPENTWTCRDCGEEAKVINGG